MATDMTVSKTILEQLGGNRFLVMTGATHLAASNNSLTFHLPKPVNKIMKIRLDTNDTYVLEMYTFRNLVVTLHESKSNIYVENLQQTFTEMTGLDTHL